MIVRELLTKIGFDVEQQKIDQAEAGVSRLKQGLVALGVGLAARAIHMVTASAAKLAADLQDSAGQLNVTARWLDVTGKAADGAGSSIQDVTMALHALNMAAAGARDGDANRLKAFEALGITLADLNGPLRDSEALFDAVNTRLAGLDDGQKKALLSQDLMSRAGKNMIKMWSEGADKVNALRQAVIENGLALNEQETGSLADYDDMLMSTGHTIQSLKNRFTLALLPALRWVNETIQTQSREGSFLRTVLDRVGVVLGFVADNAQTVGIAFGAMLTAILLITQPWWVLIGLVVLLADELYAFFTGQDSYLRDAVDQWGIWGEVIMNILLFVGAMFTTTWNVVIGVLETVFDVLYAIGGVIYGFFTFDWTFLLSVIDGFIGRMRKALEYFGILKSGGSVDATVTAVSTTTQGINSQAIQGLGNSPLFAGGAGTGPTSVDNSMHFGDIVLPEGSGGTPEQNAEAFRKVMQEFQDRNRRASQISLVPAGAR